jgi:hypothetical protein
LKSLLLARELQVMVVAEGIADEEVGKHANVSEELRELNQDRTLATEQLNPLGQLWVFME